MNNKDNTTMYAWNDAMILDKIQEILKDKNIDALELTDELIKDLMNKLSQNISSEEINECAYIVAENIEKLKSIPNEDAKDYILRLKNYLENTTVKCIKAEFKGIEFDVFKDSSVEDAFNDFYSKYDEIYGISDMLSDLGLK